MSSESFDTKVSIDLFDDDERQIINQIMTGTGVYVSRDELLSLIMDLRNLAGDEDTYFADVGDSLYSKFMNLTDEEWNGLRELFPFRVNVSATDFDNIENE